MEKMSAPKLEVIHFNTEDVIVTSGNSAATNFICSKNSGTSSCYKSSRKPQLYFTRQNRHLAERKRPLAQDAFTLPPF